MKKLLVPGAIRGCRPSKEAVRATLKNFIIGSKASFVNKDYNSFSKEKDGWRIRSEKQKQKSMKWFMDVISSINECNEI